MISYQLLTQYYVIAGTFKERDWAVQLYHIFCETNGCANALVKRGNQQQCLLETYDTCPSFVYMVFVWNMEHIGTTRMCNVKAVMLAVV